MKHRYFTIVLAMTLLACTAVSPISYATPPAHLYWSDGDSGKLGKLKFRLANIDAPETRSPNQRGGAKCETERKLGYEAKRFLVEFTKGKNIKIARDYGKDRYNRLVIDLTANGVDVASAGVEAGYLRPWPHKKGRALAPKPDWCAQ